MSRACSACGAIVAREECHKNRYAQYICRQCQSTGIKFVRQRPSHRSRRLAIQVFLFGVVVASLVFLLAWQFFAASESFPGLAGGDEAAIDTRAGVSLSAPIRARLQENLRQVAPPPKNDK
jgi:hypothetical protein